MEELNQIKLRKRKILIKQTSLHPVDYIDRLYASGKEGGRGIAIIKDCVDGSIQGITDYIHHHHHVVPLARISLTLSRHFSLSFIASCRSSGLHPVSAHSCSKYVWAGRPAFAWPYAGVHRSTSLMSSYLLLQQCPACLVRLAWIVFVMGVRWLYSLCLVGTDYIKKSKYTLIMKDNSRSGSISTFTKTTKLGIKMRRKTVLGIFQVTNCKGCYLEDRNKTMKRKSQEKLNFF